METWVRKGDSSRSKLIRELSWEGKMFGTFTQNEVEIVKRWIDALENPNGRSSAEPKPHLTRFFKKARHSRRLPNIVADSSSRFFMFFVFRLVRIFALSSTSLPLPTYRNCSFLWFASPCLFGSSFAFPPKPLTVIASAVFRLLRAQSGFEDEGPGRDRHG